MSDPMTCFEIVHFAFMPQVGVEQQSALMLRLGQWVRAQPGYVTRQFYRELAGPGWIDVIEWQSLQHAENAMQASQQAPELGPVMSLIDPGSVRMGHYQRAW